MTLRKRPRRSARLESPEAFDEDIPALEKPDDGASPAKTKIQQAKKKKARTKSKVCSESNSEAKPETLPFIYP